MTTATTEQVQLDYQDLNRPALMRLCGSRGIKVSNKSKIPEMVEKLKAQDAEQPQHPPEPPEAPDAAETQEQTQAASPPMANGATEGLDPLPTPANAAAALGRMTQEEQQIFNERREQYAYILHQEKGPETLRNFAAQRGLGPRKEPGLYVEALAAKDIQQLREFKIQQQKENQRKVSENLPEVALYISKDETTDGAVWIRDRLSGEKFCMCPGMGSGPKELRNRLPYMDHATIIVRAVEYWQDQGRP